MKRIILVALSISIYLHAVEQENVYTVPEGVSVANVFAALYERAEVLGMGIYARNSGRRLASAENAMQVFTAFCHRGSCDYVRGKCMKVSLADFPEIDLTGFNKQYGNNAGQEAIEHYIAK